VILAAVLYTTMGALVKSMAGQFDSSQLGFFRALFGWAAVWPFVLRSGVGGLLTGRWHLHLFRGTLGGLGMLCGFYAWTHLLFADAVAISYARTLFIIPLAVLFLGERVQVRRWAATLFGFAGVLVVVRPLGGIEFGTAVAVAGAVFAAGATVSMKSLSGSERPEIMLFYFGLVTTLVTLGPALAAWREPSLPQLALLMLVGATGQAAQYCLIQGLTAGEATAVAPFDYLRLLLAGILGVVLFDEVPTAWTWVGAAMIVGATLYIALREARLARERRARKP